MQGYVDSDPRPLSISKQRRRKVLNSMGIKFKWQKDDEDSEDSSDDDSTVEGDVDDAARTNSGSGSDD
jgi:hypothetical protein